MEWRCLSECLHVHHAVFRGTRFQMASTMSSPAFVACYNSYLGRPGVDPVTALRYE
jgi:hypothetical protein